MSREICPICGRRVDIINGYYSNHLRDPSVSLEEFCKYSGTVGPDLESNIGVIFRKRKPTIEDYDEAIELLQEAKKQFADPSGYCYVCTDSGHTMEICHHNPLVMARRAVGKAKSWRCYHCDAVFTTYEAAEEHFGKNQDTTSTGLD